MQLPRILAILAFAALTAQTGASALDDIAARLGKTMGELTALDESDKKIALSNATQAESTRMANREEAKIKQDVVQLQAKARDVDEFRARIVAMGCPDVQVPTVVDLALAQRCNPLIIQHRQMRDAAMRDFNSLKSRQATLDRLRYDIGQTTIENTRKTKENSARRADLVAQKEQLQEMAIMDVAKKKKLLAARACGTDRCCQGVVYDGASPRLCGIGLVCSRFSAAGLFGSGRRICDVAPSKQPLKIR